MTLAKPGKTDTYVHFSDWIGTKNNMTIWIFFHHISVDTLNTKKNFKRKRIHKWNNKKWATMSMNQKKNKINKQQKRMECTWQNKHQENERWKRRWKLASRNKMMEKKPCFSALTEAAGFARGWAGSETKTQIKERKIKEKSKSHKQSETKCGEVKKKRKGKVKKTMKASRNKTMKRQS